MTFVAPALVGQDPLGFLAAVGTLRLLAEHWDSTATLHFDSIQGMACFGGDTLPDLNACVSAVGSVFADLGTSSIPGMPPDFPPPGPAPDKLRADPEQLRDKAATWAASAQDPAVAYRWVRALVTDIAVDRSGRAAITPFAAPSGKQSFSTMFVGTKAAVEARPSALREAYVGWRRVPGYTGEYLDHRVLMSSADAPTRGDAKERGVPGATWLALMALPVFPVTGSGGRRSAVGWQRVAGRDMWRWPLWSQPLDVANVSLLVNHPALALKSSTELARTSARRDLRRLGVFAVAMAGRKRIPGRKSDGVLVPLNAIAL